MNTKMEVDVINLGVLAPTEVEQQELFAGEVCRPLVNPCPGRIHPRPGKFTPWPLRRDHSGKNHREWYGFASRRTHVALPKTTRPKSDRPISLSLAPAKWRTKGQNCPMTGAQTAPDGAFWLGKIAQVLCKIYVRIGPREAKAAR